MNPRNRNGRAAQGAVARAEQAVRAVEGRSAHIDARGQKVERISEYFDFSGPDGDDKAKLKVRRIELLAILDAIEKGKKHNTPLRRLWRWLRSKRGPGGVHAVPPTQGEIDRGEATPA